MPGLPVLGTVYALLVAAGFIAHVWWQLRNAPGDTGGSDDPPPPPPPDDDPRPGSPPRPPGRRRRSAGHRAWTGRPPARPRQTPARGVRRGPPSTPRPVRSTTSVPR